MDKIQCTKCKGFNCDFKGSSDKRGIYLDDFGCRDCGYTANGKIYLDDLKRWG